MESTSEAGKIQISEAVKGLLPEGAFAFTDRGERDVKGKGMMRTFFVDGLLCPPELLAGQGRADSFGERQSPHLRDRSQTMEARAGACGTSNSSITTCGTAICPRGPTF